MASLLRFADKDYFLSGNFFEDLEFHHPILVDPLWQGTKLETQFQQFPLPVLETPNHRSFGLVTSGSTGVPKIVWKEWEEIQSELEVWAKEKEIQSFLDGIREIQVQVPFCHLYGLLWGYLLPKQLGLPIVFRDGYNHSETTLYITSAPQLQLAFSQGMQLPKRAIVSGMKFPVPLARELREKTEISIIEIYGSTETGGMGYRDPLRQNRFQLLPNLQFQFQSVEENQELLVKSPFVSKQYYSLQSSAWELHKLPTNSYYATGDLGENSDLGFYLLGRKDRIIKHKGKRVSLDRIESEILGLGLEGQFFCVPVHHETGDTIGLFTDSLQPIDTIYQTLRNELPSSHVPRVIVKQNEIPKLPNGKTDYSKISSFCYEEFLRLQSLKEKGKNIQNINSETTIPEILESILGSVPKPDQHFIYDCGMDSILFSELILKLEKKIGYPIPEEDKQTGYLFSLSGLEEYIREKLYLIK
ncbi:non-ribosomal peptide synthetase [Leptospira paudalimensis]|uniref:AMP-binding protein n=1 Tax=Leptospira paudalimensis TaxID=2950024 RepID=A0ABT3MBY5_9LEPT|nr:AMP-binding protein [Leptospira paudalimensis]MCW7505895.1 AMP-binding protein [Leptospira paudalimensis]